MWQEHTDFDNEHKEAMVNCLVSLSERLAHQSLDESMIALGAVCLLSDQDSGVYRKLADYYYSNQNWIGSIANFNKCCSLNPKDFNSMFYLANAYKNLGCFNQAIDVYKKSLEIHEYPEAMVNLASTYNAINKKDFELELIERLIANFPDFTLGYYNLGIFWYGQKNMQKSIESYQRALAINPQHGDSKVAMSLALLMDKQYVKGFEMHDSRWGVSPNCPIREFNRPYWHGQDVTNGSSILVTLEQGFGDTLQMLRYLPMIASVFSEVAIEVQPQMQRLVTLAFPDINVVVHGHELPQTDFYCPIMSLPRAFNTDYATIPIQSPYIFIPSHDSVNSCLLNDPRKKIGVCWRGGMLNPSMAHRSLSFKSIKLLFQTDDYNWVSLVKDIPDDELAELRNTPVIDLTSELSDFYDTYRLISDLDLVISVDTAVAHLAGAMGKPTIVILNDGYDWRWHIDDEVSAWYPGTRLLRSYKLATPDSLVQALLAQVKEMLS